TSVLGRFTGKTAIVTASTDGIGFAIAQRLGQDGAHVVISSRKEANVNKTVDMLKEQKLSASGVVCHVGKGSDRAKLLEQVKSVHGRADILVCNAAVNPYFGPMLGTPENAVDKIFEVNVKSTFMLIKESVPLLQAGTNPSILVVSSIAAYHSMDFLGMYSVSKTALVALTKTLAPELGPMNIRINCLSPGIIKTKFSSALWKDPALHKQFLKQVPLGRVGLPEDCGNVAAHMCSDDAAYMTGESVVVSGGMPS
uniref:Dehydrogenase/reductase SDR family member 4 n=1 Tax=Ciona savignyi TaxID=51511 RepID=H2Z9Q6_CIOSA